MAEPPATKLSAPVHAPPSADATRSTDAGRSAQVVRSAEAVRSGQQSRQVSVGEPVDIDARDEGVRTALMLAILNGRGGAVNALLAHGADPNAADAAGTMPLAAALDRADPAIVSALRRAGLGWIDRLRASG